MRKKGCASAPRAGHPLPAHRIVGGVGVDQRVPEPFLADPPVDEQMLDQERGGDHARAVVHPAGLPELAHAGIDDRVAGPPALPGPDVVGIGLGPGEVVEGGFRLLAARSGCSSSRCQANSRQPSSDRNLVRAAPAGAAGNGVPDLTGADLAETQMRREARGGVGRRPVAFRAVARRGASTKAASASARRVRPAARHRECRRPSHGPPKAVRGIRGHRWRWGHRRGYASAPAAGAGGFPPFRARARRGRRRGTRPGGRADRFRRKQEIGLESSDDGAGSRQSRQRPFRQALRGAIAAVPVERRRRRQARATSGTTFSAGPWRRTRACPPARRRAAEACPATGAATSAPRRRAGGSPGSLRRAHRAGRSAHRADRRRPGRDCRQASDRRETRRASGPGQRSGSLGQRAVRHDRPRNALNAIVANSLFGGHHHWPRRRAQMRPGRPLEQEARRVLRTSPEEQEREDHAGRRHDHRDGSRDRR